ncbi:molybdopterin-binding protein, partial [Psychrobacter sp. 1U2]
MSKPATKFTPLNIAVLTVSDSRTLAEDTSGQYLADSLTDAGHHLADRKLITDDIYQIRAVISGWIADPNVHAVITTGGTGFFIRDSMPEAVNVLFDKSIDGFGEMFRLISKDEIGMSTVQSRAV